ncbi:Phophatidylserine decarboxylase-domain-containing protein [Pisolithus thermaeus]|nr:Phophatidylserine decarboxylase-domain-containing protein [Pisolithus thermaeus]
MASESVCNGLCQNKSAQSLDITRSRDMLNMPINFDYHKILRRLKMLSINARQFRVNNLTMQLVGIWPPHKRVTTLFFVLSDKTYDSEVVVFALMKEEQFSQSIAGLCNLTLWATEVYELLTPCNWHQSKFRVVRRRFGYDVAIFITHMDHRTYHYPNFRVNSTRRQVTVHKYSRMAARLHQSIQKTMSPSLYVPSHGRWVVNKPAVLDGWTYGQRTLPRALLPRDKKVFSNDRKLAPVIQEFQQLIEDDPELFMHFYRMFDEVQRPNSKQNHVNNYKELMVALDRIITQAPRFGGANNLVMGVPIYAVLAPFCNTPSGYSVFTNAKVNTQLHKVFDVWAEFLVSPESCYVLSMKEQCWFSPMALDVMSERLGMSFYDAWAYVCTIQSNVRAVDKFWIKGHLYLLSHIFNHDPFTPLFVGGTVYQGILSSLDYHHWHSPVDGIVRKTCLIPGTYYAARLDNDADPDVVSRSQDFVTAIAARALIFIESDNPVIGLMCFVAVGLGEVSTCEITVKGGDRLKKGDDLGSFHFGGSTHCLVFRPQTPLKPFPHVQPGTVQNVNSNIFYIEDGTEKN